MFVPKCVLVEIWRFFNRTGMLKLKSAFWELDLKVM